MNKISKIFKKEDYHTTITKERPNGTRAYVELPKKFLGKKVIILDYDALMLYMIMNENKYTSNVSKYANNRFKTKLSTEFKS